MSVQPKSSRKAKKGVETGTDAPRHSADIQWIEIKGARTHNLKDVSVRIPRNQLTVITGISGSGKSSLALDTLFSEGQRQYLESLSVYARQFVHQLQRADVDSIEGLQPSLCIDQKVTASNPRSTVGTTTEIYDYLRVLMARAGTPACPTCGDAISQQSRDQIQSSLQSHSEGSKLMIMAPVVRGRQGKHADVFQGLRKAGLTKVRINSETHDLDVLPELSLRKRHTIEGIVDRIVVRAEVEQRIGDAIDLALRLSDGLVSIAVMAPGEQVWSERSFSTRYACADCGVNIPEIEPRTFSFNSPYGTCPACKGIGKQSAWELPAVFPDLEAQPWQRGCGLWQQAPTASLKKKIVKHLEKVLAPLTVDPNGPLQKSREAIEKDWDAADSSLQSALDRLAESLGESPDDSDSWLFDFRGSARCSECDGSRIHAAARAVKVAGKSLPEICAQPVVEVWHWVQSLLQNSKDQEPRMQIAAPLIQEMEHRLKFLCSVGVDYLTLGREVDSLSGGEMQRVRLARSIGSGLIGVCYILDEPSIGLHPRDNDVLIDSIRALQQQGCTVIVVEHDEAIMRACDWLIDVGPGAGRQGGQVVAIGHPEEVARHETSTTGKYLSGRAKIPPPAEYRSPSEKVLRLIGVETQNLKSVDVTFPLGCLVGVSGVSGSGKSSLVNQTLAPALRRHLGLNAKRLGVVQRIEGVEHIEKLIQIDQRPIGRSPRSTPATYSGVFDNIRKVYAATRDAKQRGFAANRFSFNAGAGRCETCQGQGQQKIEMNFLADIYVTCPTCRGKRFNRQTLSVRYKDHTIADVLAMNIETACEFFENFDRAFLKLDAMRRVGLGYLTLGQPSNTLSGGESQRIKLASELASRSSGKSVYLLDEPTTGLHSDDIGRLLFVLQGLVDQGNTVIVIEHNVDVLRSCDWLIDLGPEGGDAGGEIVATGTPKEIAQNARSLTGRYL